MSLTVPTSLSRSYSLASFARNNELSILQEKAASSFTNKTECEQLYAGALALFEPLQNDDEYTYSHRDLVYKIAHFFSCVALRMREHALQTKDMRLAEEAGFGALDAADKLIHLSVDSTVMDLPAPFGFSDKEKERAIALFLESEKGELLSDSDVILADMGKLYLEWLCGYVSGKKSVETWQSAEKAIKERKFKRASEEIKNTIELLSMVKLERVISSFCCADKKEIEKKTRFNHVQQLSKENDFFVSLYNSPIRNKLLNERFESREVLLRVVVELAEQEDSWVELFLREIKDFLLLKESGVLALCYARAAEVRKSSQLYEKALELLPPLEKCEEFYDHMSENYFLIAALRSSIEYQLADLQRSLNNVFSAHKAAERAVVAAKALIPASCFSRHQLQNLGISLFGLDVREESVFFRQNTLELERIGDEMQRKGRFSEQKELYEKALANLSSSFAMDPWAFRLYFARIAACYVEPDKDVDAQIIACQQRIRFKLGLYKEYLLKSKEASFPESVIAHLCLEEYEQAQALLQKDPNAFRKECLLGRVEQICGDQKKAAQHYAKAHSLIGANDERARALLFFQQGEITKSYSLFGEYESFTDLLLECRKDLQSVEVVASQEFLHRELEPWKKAKGEAFLEFGNRAEGEKSLFFYEAGIKFLDACEKEVLSFVGLAEEELKQTLSSLNFEWRPPILDNQRSCLWFQKAQLLHKLQRNSEVIAALKQAKYFGERYEKTPPSKMQIIEEYGQGRKLFHPADLYYLNACVAGQPFELLKAALEIYGDTLKHCSQPMVSRSELFVMRAYARMRLPDALSKDILADFTEAFKHAGALPDKFKILEKRLEYCKGISHPEIPALERQTNEIWGMIRARIATNKKPQPGKLQVRFSDMDVTSGLPTLLTPTNFPKKVLKTQSMGALLEYNQSLDIESQKSGKSLPRSNTAANLREKEFFEAGE